MTDDLELLIAEMAREEAHHHQCSLAEATRQIRALVAEAREEYRAAGTPYGDDRGFCRSRSRRALFQCSLRADRLGSRLWRMQLHACGRFQCRFERDGHNIRSEFADDADSAIGVVGFTQTTHIK